MAPLFRPPRVTWLHNPHNRWTLPYSLHRRLYRSTPFQFSFILSNFRARSKQIFAPPTPGSHRTDSTSRVARAIGSTFLYRIVISWFQPKRRRRLVQCDRPLPKLDWQALAALETVTESPLSEEAGSLFLDHRRLQTPGREFAVGRRRPRRRRP